VNKYTLGCGCTYGRLSPTAPLNHRWLSGAVGVASPKGENHNLSNGYLLYRESPYVIPVNKYTFGFGCTYGRLYQRLRSVSVRVASALAEAELKIQNGII
jgi:hypothetical protein